MIKRELKFKFIFKHPKSKEVIISSAYTLDEILETSLEDIQEKACTCNCQPIGETNVVECNCDDYYQHFKLIDKIQYIGIKDKKEEEIYEGHRLRYSKRGHPDYECQVKWDPEMCCFEFIEMINHEVSKGFVIHSDHTPISWPDKMEIIGNIYQKEAKKLKKKSV